jgi:hypothetical protein
MPENAHRSDVGLFDQFEDEHRIADWGGDELFTRMPRRRPVDDAPAPRFRPSLVHSDPASRPESPARARRPLRLVDPPADRTAPADRPRTGEPAMRERSERLGLAVVDPALRQPLRREPARREPARRQPALRQPSRREPARREPTQREPTHRFDESGSLIEREPAGRPTKVITGRPGDAPRPLPVVRGERRRRSPRTPAEWIGPRPERIVGWAFALGILLILIAITTADAATV